MPSTCLFLLNNPNYVYYSGQTISGSIRLTTTSDKEVRNVRIQFSGEAKVHWNESESYRNHDGKHRTRTVSYRGHETYVDNTTTVFGQGTLPAGTHNYDFNIQLPVNCPTSCEGKYGQIRYQLTLILDRPFRFDNEFTQPLTVLKTVDLNYNPTHRIAIQAEDTSSIGCWPCASGDILYKLTLPQSGYCPGQTVCYQLHIQNQSMADIKGYRVDFIQTMTFTAHTPHNKSRRKDITLASRTHSDECLRQMNRIFRGELTLPSMPPTTEGFGIIRIDYHMELEMTIDGCHTNDEIDAAIFIGNVPLVNVNPQNNQSSSMPMPQTSNQYMPSVPTAPQMPMPESNGRDAPPTYLDTQPPTFAEAVRSESPFIDPDAKEHSRVIGFRPMYPMYPSAPNTE